MTSTTRAQSEVIGELLFTAVVVIAVALVAVFVLSGVDTTTEPAAEIGVDANDSHVLLTHGGGDGTAATDLRVFFGADASGDDGLENFSELAGDGDGRFEGGERRARSHGASDVLAVTVVHEPTDTVLATERLDVPDA